MKPLVKERPADKRPADKSPATRRLALITLALTPWLLGAGRVEVAPGVELHYVEAGEGQPIVFVPGWTLTTELFQAQIEGLSDHHRVLALDPRSHGKSTKTTEGNTYAQHGRDLGTFLEQLDLDEVVLVGWSSGAHSVLSYVREHGVDRLRGVVLIDEPPKAVGDTASEWVWGTFEGYRSTLESVLYRRRSSAEGLVRWMMVREPTAEELDWIVEQSLQTPTEAALSLMVDTTVLDYTAEAHVLEGAVPLLFMVRQSWAEKARVWVEEHLPAAEVVVLESHAEHLEQPEVFNAKLDRFLADLGYPPEEGQP